MNNTGWPRNGPDKIGPGTKNGQAKIEAEVQNKAEIKVKDEAEQGAVTSTRVPLPSHFLPLNLSLNLPLNAPHLKNARVCPRPPERKLLLPWDLRLIRLDLFVSAQT